MTPYISESIHEVYKTLFEALILVIIVAVSYTHLQCIIRTLQHNTANSSNRELQSHRHTDIQSVSYTHLDVYKRQELLEKEGITFKRNGCVNMSKHLWDITGSLTSTIGISPTSATWQ